MKYRMPSWAVLLFAPLAVLVTIGCLVSFNQVQPTLLAGTGVPLTQSAPATLVHPTANFACPNGDCVTACLSKIHSILQTSSAPQSPPQVAVPHGSTTQTITLVTYDIQGDQITSPRLASNIPSDLIPYQNDSASQQNIWNYFSQMVPASYRSNLIEYIVSTDGKGGMLASVEESSNPPYDWALNVDPLDAAKPVNLTFTLTHEFGHLLTLNSAQVTPDPVIFAHPDDLQIYQDEARGCSQYFTNVGCSQPNSYINQFFQTFWPKIYNEWSQVNAQKDQAGYYTDLEHFYRRHPTQFVSTYAATSPEEDIAESWAHFVLGSMPPRDSIGDEKILFFYQYPELVQLREQMIFGICNYASQ